MPDRPARPVPAADSRCPCGSGDVYGECCGPLLDPATDRKAATAVQLMRSRYTAFAVGDSGYLLDTWYPATRPFALDLDPSMVWERLEILESSHGGPFDTTGTVRFAAHYRVGPAHDVQRETSRFVREHGRWYYLRGRTE